MNQMREVNQVISNAMRVKDLIEALESCDPDAFVVVSSNYGDYHNTQQVLPLTENFISDMESSDFCESAYSHSGIALGRENEDEDEEEDEIAQDEILPVVLFRL